MVSPRKFLVIAAVIVSAIRGSARAASYLNLASFGQLSSWSEGQPKRFADLRGAGGYTNLGLEWDEERDIREIRVRYAGNTPKGAAVEYWFQNWPYDPPKMPSIEDPMDDPWQGRWLRAAVTETCDGPECRYAFEPLAETENARAPKLPGLRYRRTLKVRVSWPGEAPSVSALEAFSDSEEMPRRIRVDVAGDGSFSVYNGRLLSVSRVRLGGFLLDLVTAKPALPGSHDLTVVTFHSSRKDGAFSFCTDDLKQGPIYVPDFDVRITDAEKGSPAPVRQSRERVRRRIPREPEQTYERASREIPPLDPWHRESGGLLYLPLAADSSWQKFAFELGGNVFISKSATKAKGRELERLQWTGDRITWRIGTGATPLYGEDHKVSLAKLDGYLPVITQRWEGDGLRYTEEAFATLLRGPLSPEDPARNEETAAVLMIRVLVENPAGAVKKAHIWFSNDPAEPLSVDGNAVFGEGKLLRAVIEFPSGASVAGKAVHVSFDVPPAGAEAMVIKLPFVSDLGAQDRRDLEHLNYRAQRETAVSYWKQIVAPSERFSVPEPKFNDLARSVIAQIHLSTAKDPNSGLYMVPAASYVYDVFENEAAYQILLLDTLGLTKTADSYLEPMMQLQGSRNFPGMHKGSFAGVFHGARISATYDYTAHGYGLDHGTVLWTLAQHYLYTRDRQWLERAWPHMHKAIDWIVEQRATTKMTSIQGKRVREYGLLPASQLEDNPDWAHWFIINAYAWAGMSRTAEALADIGHPEAEHIRREAFEFRNDLRNAVLRAIEAAPVVRMQDGTYEPYVPVLPTRRFRIFGSIRREYYERYGVPSVNPLFRLGADRETLCGPVLMLFLGLFDLNEPIANWILDDWEDNGTLSSGMGMNVHGMTDDQFWFSQGGMVFQANLVNPIPAYLRLHEIPAAIRTLYNDFVSCLYPEATVFTEEYHQWRHGSGPFYKISDEARFVSRLRDTLVLEDGDTLWLAAGTPRRWLASRDGIRVDKVETFFGPVSYRLHAASAPNAIEGTVTLPSRNPAKKAWLVVRTPAGHISSVTLNGKAWTRIDRALEAIELPASGEPVAVRIQYR